MLQYSNFYSELKPIGLAKAGPVIKEDCWWGQDEIDAQNGQETPVVAVAVVEPETDGNLDGSIDATPKNPVISAAKNNSEPENTQAIAVVTGEEKALYERWNKMFAIKELR